MMADREKVIHGLELVKEDIRERFVSGSQTCTDCLRIDKAIAMLKEQEAVEPKTGHWIFEDAYCEAWSHTCSECGKRMSTAYNTYANYCWNCGAKMEGR